jgi:hypothetical protein
VRYYFPLFLIFLPYFSHLFAYNANHGPFAEDSEVEYLQLKMLKPLEEPTFLWGTEKETEVKLRDDGSLVYPSQFYREARFEIDDFHRYRDGREHLILRSFYNDYDLGLDDIYLSVQGSDESFFYGAAYHFTEYMAIGGLEVYESDLNQDGHKDYILIKYAGGNGIGAGTADIGFLLSSEAFPGYTFQVMVTMYPDDMDFVVIDGKPHFIHCSFHYGGICKDNKNHNFWAYNLYRFDGDELVLSNNSSREFPKTIWYSFKPNNKETDLLYPEQKTQIHEDSLAEILVKKGELAIEWRAGIKSIINAFKTKDMNEIANVISYPIELGYPFTINNKKEFFRWHYLLIDDKFIDMIANSSLDDWSQIGWRGVCYGQGDVWLGDASYGLIDAINYDTRDGKQRYVYLHKKIRESVHPSVSDYAVNKMDLISNKYRIRLDYLDDESLRLSVWDASSAIGLKPLFVIKNGEEEWQGSGGYYYATFKSGNKTYKYTPLGKYSPRFSIYEDGKLIYEGDVSDYPYDLSGRY